MIVFRCGVVLQIRVEDSVEFPASDVQYLNDHLLRFRLVSTRDASTYHRFFLGEYSSADKLFPGAPDRKAVEYNLASLAKALDAGLARMRERPFVEGTAIRSRQDLMTFNVDHFCRPTYLYTNGQANVSLVKRNQDRFELAYHPSLRDFWTFGSDYEIGILIEPDNVQVARSFEGAERLAQERLFKVATYTLRVQTGTELDQLVLQPAGSRGDTHGYPLETLIAAFRGDGFRVQMGGPPCGDNEPYRVLNEFRPAGFALVVCATCEHFRFTGMTRDMSGGNRGYCTSPSKENGKLGLSNIVSVRDWCPEYRFVMDQERKIPYLSRG